MWAQMRLVLIFNSSAIALENNNCPLNPVQTAESVKSVHWTERLFSAHAICSYTAQVGCLTAQKLFTKYKGHQIYVLIVVMN